MSERSPSCKSTLSSAAFHSTKAAYAHPSVRQQSKRSLNRCPEACGVRKLCQDTLSSVGVGTRSVTKPVYHIIIIIIIIIDCRDHRLCDSNHDPRGEEQEEEELEMEKNEIKTILHDNHIGETEREREGERETRRDKTVKLDTPSRLRAFAGSGDWSEPEPDQRELRRGTRSPTFLEIL